MSQDTFPIAYAKRTLLASLVIMGMGFSVLFPVLAPLGRELNLTEFQITSIIAASSLTIFLAAPVWGRWSDVWGRKRIMLVGLFGFCGGTIVFTSVLAAGMKGLLVGLPLYLSLVIARVATAGLMSASMPASTAYMADITDVATRTKGMGATGAANNIGSMLGPTLAGLAILSMLAPLWIIAFFALLNGLFVLRFLPEPPRASVPARPGRRMRYTDPRILPFIFVGVLMFMGFAIVQQTMGFRFQDALSLTAGETAQVFGIAMMLSAGTSLFAQGVIVQRIDIAPFTLLKLAIPLLVIAFLVMGLSESRMLLTIGMMVQGFGMGLAGPGFMSGASLAVAPEEQGAVAGVAGSCGPLGFTIGPLVGGILYQIDPVAPYFFAAAVYVLLMLGMQWLGNRVTVHSTPSSSEESDRQS